MEISRNKLIAGLAQGYNVAGCVHPLRPQMTARGKVPTGSTVSFAVEEACRAAGVRKRHMKYGVAQIGTRDIENGVTIWRPILKKHWETRKLKEGELLRFRLLPRGGGGGGGGGKNPLRTILMVVVAVVAIVTSALTYGALTPAWSAAYAGIASSVAGLAVTTIGMALVNAVAPVAAPSFGKIGSSSRASESQVYGIDAGRNAINQWGRVPVPLGIGRFAPPKAASSYTQTIGDDQYLHELLCIGIGDIEVSDIKIGTTPISDFTDCQYEIYKYTPENKKRSDLFVSGVRPESLSIELKKDVVNARTTYDCTSIELDFSFQGLAYFNDQGGTNETSVEVLIEYKKSSSTEWGFTAMKKYHGGKTFGIWEGNNYFYVTPDGGVQRTNALSSIPENGAPVAYVVGAKKYFETTFISYDRNENWDYVTRSGYENVPSIATTPSNTTPYTIDGFSVSTISPKFVSSYYDDVRLESGSITISGGYITRYGSSLEAGVGKYVTYSGSQSSLLRKTYTISGLERGSYDVRVTRITDDSTNDRLRNNMYWTAIRAITNDNPVNTPYGINLMAIKIRATGQLNGAIDTLTLRYATKILDWDKNTQTWVKQVSTNPAAIMRYVLQNSEAMARPQSDSLIDLPSLQAASEYWELMRYNYSLVCDASASVFERVQSICASGLASPTMVDGKWAIIIDKPRENIACAFTSANSWGWSFKRSQIVLPNAVHCTFINQDTWDTDMRVVPTDEPVGSQYIFESQTYEGVNSAEQIYKLARFHYADAKMRRRTITMRCYDESLLCTRGDLVDCAVPSISPFGLQVGRVRNVVKDADGNVEEIYTDQFQTTDLSGRRFGVKVYNSEGVIFHAEVKPEDKTQKKLTLLTPQQMNISAGDKYAFGDYNEETFKAVVLSLKPNTDWTCDVTLQDYIPELYDLFLARAPEWTSAITKTIEQKWKLYSKPVVDNVATDESVLLMHKDGTLSPQIVITTSTPNDIDPRAVFISADISLAGKNEWKSIVKGADIDQTTITASNVVELEKYDIRLYYSGASGETGNFEFVNNINVIGKTSLPPSVSGFAASINSPMGIALSWDELSILDITKYKISGDATLETVASSAIVQVKNKIGGLNFSIVAIDTGGRVSAVPAVTAVTVEAPSTPISLTQDTRTDGFYLTWGDCTTTFPVRNYTIKDVFTNKTSIENKTEVVIPPRGAGQYSIQVRATDIFDNSGAIATLDFSVVDPVAPAVSVSVAQGVVRLTWDSVASSFPISTYQVHSVDGVLLQETKSTFFDVNGAAGTLEYRIRAVDSAGNKSPFTEASLVLTAPEQPVVSVVLNENKDGLVVSWSVPQSMLPVMTYDIVRQWVENGVTKEEDYGSTDSTLIAVPPVVAGVHTFMVRAVDQSGNKSGWGFTDMNVMAPESAFITDANVIDNNVQIYWLEPQRKFFAIAYYNFGTVEDGYFSLIGRVDARFAVRAENKAGNYTYQVCPVDVAGNIGTCSNITATVAQPPDFVFYDDYDSTFNGTKTNAILDGRGSMIMPVIDETWEANNTRVAGLIGATPSSLTWSQKSSAGYEYWLSPRAATATYIEVVDLGTSIPSTKITVTLSGQALEGFPQKSCKIEISSDGTVWRTAATNSFSVYASDFRYVRYTIGVTGGMMSINSINYRLDVKKKSDFGTVQSNATDNGEGFIDKDTTPMLYGTWVNFAVAFTDVQAGPIVFCNEEGKTAYVSFEDTLHPTGFRVYVLDRNGTRVSGQVSWSAHGV